MCIPVDSDRAQRSIHCRLACNLYRSSHIPVNSVRIHRSIHPPLACNLYRSSHILLHRHFQRRHSKYSLPDSSMDYNLWDN